jgi:hypothetical protein
VLFKHAPPAVAHWDQDFEIHATVTHPELVKQLTLHVVLSDGTPIDRPFRRSRRDDYVASVESDALHGESLTYRVSLLSTSGKRQNVFATPESPHTVQLVPTAIDLNERVLLQRVKNRRNAFVAFGEYVNFGQSQLEPGVADDSASAERVPDHYYRLEASYVHRPLRLVSEFSLRVGLVRGRSPVPVSGAADSDSAAQRRVGLNYAAPTVRFRANDWVYVDGELLASVTEVGFSTGAGSAVILGDPYGTRLMVGFETIEVFGTRLFSRTDLAVHPDVTVAPIIEVTDMPHASRFGVRLLGEVALAFRGGLRAHLRGGYQARTFDSGGPAFGGAFSYEL